MGGVLSGPRASFVPEGALLFAPFRAWDRFLFSEVDARQLAALRIAVGALAFLTIAGIAPHAVFFHSNEGWYPLKEALRLQGDQPWSLLHTFTSAFGVRVFTAGALLAAAALTLGWHARLAAVATFVALVSYQQRDPLINYGGDTTIKLLVFGLMLGQCGRAWSIDALRARWRGVLERSERGETDMHRAARRERRPRATVPVWPLRLVQFQVATIYFWSGLAKFHGSDWHQGIALGTAVTNPQLARFDLAELATVPAVKLAMQALTVITLWWELLFPFLLVHRWGRWAAIGIGTGVHLGIFGLMRVHWFGHIMIASYIAFVPERTIRGVALRLRRTLARRARRRRLHVIYDSDCPLCRRTVASIAVLDWLGAVALVPARETQRWRRFAPRLASAAVRAEMHAVAPGKEPLAGVDAFAAIGRVVPAFLPLSLLCLVPGVRAIGRRAYAAIALRRYEIVRARCADGICTLPALHGGNAAEARDERAGAAAAPPLAEAEKAGSGGKRGGAPPPDRDIEPGGGK